jgi:hypothetical protein
MHGNISPLSHTCGDEEYGVVVCYFFEGEAFVLAYSLDLLNGSRCYSIELEGELLGGEI